MSATNPGTNNSRNSKWVRLNVGGKVFQTTKDTLSRHPESFLARLVNGDLHSEKDESGAYLIDGNPEHFRHHFDLPSQRYLLCEADFYNIQPLVDEIQMTMGSVNFRSEIIMLFVDNCDNKDDECQIVCSEKNEDYEVLQAFRDKFDGIQDAADEGVYWFPMPRISAATRMEIEMILSNFGFVEETFNDNHEKGYGYRTRYWKFVRTVSK
ncbi:BTB/POZ domain-containing protein [Ditylenchus destructor]|uniref:BTB/POZ domain-containing protein n=1 Tax=Ditylenchus destructor TaxID=166010 RepID=A0AAD4MPY3_9BILA|nr:BTB/POZ domain-containing protein [Ditylenchus destructor]